MCEAPASSKRLATYLPRWGGSVANATGSRLAGKRVVVTRTLEQSELLSRELEARGATVRLVPLIRFAPPEDPAPFDAALRALGKFDWLFLTSQNVVRAIV